MRSVQLVNRHFYLTAQLVTHRHKTLNLSEKDSTLSLALSRLTRWLDDDLVLRGIRHLTVAGHPQYIRHQDGDIAPEEDSYKWTLLARLLEKLMNLRLLTFTYDGQFPLIVLDALHKHHPKAQLRIYNFRRPSCSLDHNNRAEIALSTSPALTALKANVWYGGGSGLDFRVAAFQRILANAPNLKFASITTGHSGCEFRWLSPEVVAEQEQKAALFLGRPRPNSAVETLILDGYELSKATLDHWAQFVDLSGLVSLKCSRGMPDISYFTAAPSLLKNLKNVSLNFAYNTHVDLAAAAENYLCSCSSLTTLSLWSWMDVVSLPTVLKHGPTLENLQLHEREATSSGQPRGLLSYADVKLVRDSCPNLKDFTLDIDREEENWEDEVQNPQILEELALFGPQLGRIQLYLDLGIMGAIENAGFGRRSYTSDVEGQLSEDSDNNDMEKDNERKVQAFRKRRVAWPLRTREHVVTYATFMWKTIFGAKTTGPRALDVKVGEWERKSGGGYPADWILWEQSNKQYWTVRPHERDDRPGEFVVQPWKGYR